MVAAFSGWLLDAFDFFLVTFCLTAIARDFHKTDAQIALVITLTLAFRPVGGFVFGMLADRYGRRVPLMINIGLFAFAEILTGLAVSYSQLLLIRALFGVVMGGQWGVGASLVMEKAPANKRGLLSGLLQEGYAAGNVLAALSFFLLYGRVGWRPLFFLGSLPALLLVLLIRYGVKESDVWKQSKNTQLGRSMPRNCVTLEAFSLLTRIHDNDALCFARHSGYVSYLPAASMALQPHETSRHHRPCRGSCHYRGYHRPAIFQNRWGRRRRNQSRHLSWASS